MRCNAYLSPVVKYHGLARRHLTAPGFVMRPLLNSGTFGGLHPMRLSRPFRDSSSLALCLFALACNDESRPVASATSVETSPSGTSWAACGFPADAHSSTGIVKLRVLVNPNGAAVVVEILKASDPIFAAHARSCALTKAYRPARNSAGELIAAYTPPFSVRFVR